MKTPFQPSLINRLPPAILDEQTLELQNCLHTVERQNLRPTIPALDLRNHGQKNIRLLSLKKSLYPKPKKILDASPWVFNVIWAP